ncbi:MAG TPA: nicotinate-nucleotide adenylyltransferase [Desulfatiglandales bacterium]|nr:nicotinate-nucleotide adenylyltransferase [Desulfatiglandales bacterium]
MRLGILGGTFDPIHFGHLRIAEEICEEMELEKVLLIPGALPPHKYEKSITPFHDRLAMTRIAAQDSSFLEVLDLEGRRNGPSYSIETLREIHRLYKDQADIFFIIGMDAFLEIKTWKEYKNLFKKSNFVVLKRPGFSFEELASFIPSLEVDFRRMSDSNTFAIPSGNLIIYKEATLMDISSTRIREMVAAGRSIRFLLPEAVRDYIIEKSLYGTNEYS